MIENIAMILLAVAVSSMISICIFDNADFIQDFIKREYGGTKEVYSDE